MEWLLAGKIVTDAIEGKDGTVLEIESIATLHKPQQPLKSMAKPPSDTRREI